MTWGKHGGPCFKVHTIYYICCTQLQTIFFVKWGNCTHQYMLEPISLCTIQNIASMLLNSHALQYETSRWGTSDESNRLCALFLKQVREYKYHALIQCFAFDHICICFPRIFDQTRVYGPTSYDWTTSHWNKWYEKGFHIEKWFGKWEELHFLDDVWYIPLWILTRNHQHTTRRVEGIYNRVWYFY